MNLITSNQNPIMKEIISLKLKKSRDKKKLYFIEGIRFVEEALKENLKINKIIISDIFEQTKGATEILTQISTKKFELYKIPNKLFKEISDTDNPQGILAVINIQNYQIEDITNDNNFIIILDSLQDPGNLGTIIRTADAAGVTGIIVSSGCVDIYNPKVLRSTMGSIFHVPIYYSSDLPLTIELLKSKGIKIYAAHLNGNSNCFNSMKCENIGLIIGNEANGIRDEISILADRLLKIPMPGNAESLNASIAGGILIYEIVRQKLAKISL